MTSNLQHYFPMIRTREDILTQINNSHKLSACFYGWTMEQRTEFLDFCTGVKGVKILYDSFSKEILNPESAPERLEDLLSLLLRREVHILYALPNDSTRIADEHTLLITDIVVELDDGSIANIEIQQIGYKFPGERCACYSADMLLRQYKRVRDSRKQNFSYEDIKSVYTIVLFEKSASLFHVFPDTYIHFFQQQSDSGLEMELLQRYIFIPLDIFKHSRHNKPIENRLQAWLTFFCEDSPERIIELITAYPEFKFMYEDIYRICQNMEEVMGFFSEELRILDRNTVQLMIDEMQEELDTKKEELNTMNEELNAKNEELDAKNEELDAKNEELSIKSEELNAKSEELDAKNEELSIKSEELNAKNEELNIKSKELNAKNEELNIKSEELNAKNEELSIKSEELNAKNEELVRKNTLLAQKDAQLQEALAELARLRAIPTVDSVDSANSADSAK